MFRPRLLLTLLLCLVIPLQGMAGVLATVAACPMAQAAAQHPSMNMDYGTTDGCCESVSTPGQNGKTCKTGQGCASGAHIVPAIRQAMKFGSVAAEVFSMPQSFLPALPPSGIWRPPAFI